MFHPLFLYEMIWNLCGAGVIVLLERRFTLGWGRSLAIYFIWYGLGRSGLEAIRIDPTSDAPLGIPANIWASFAVITVGIVILVVQSMRHHEPEPSPYLPGHEPAAGSVTSRPESSETGESENTSPAG
ncbi:prolipoprotein diacylglyceryl transferase family protein [Agromyces sp. NPDC055520]